MRAAPTFFVAKLAVVENAGKRAASLSYFLRTANGTPSWRFQPVSPRHRFAAAALTTTAIPAAALAPSAVAPSAIAAAAVASTTAAAALAAAALAAAARLRLSS